MEVLPFELLLSSFTRHKFKDFSCEYNLNDLYLKLGWTDMRLGIYLVLVMLAISYIGIGAADEIRGFYEETACFNEQNC